VKSPEITKKFYIKGDRAMERLMNLEKLAKEHCNGNFSEMVNTCIDKCFGLDPETGEKLVDRPTGAPRRRFGKMREIKERIDK